jgi:hypothetical protein
MDGRPEFFFGDLQPDPGAGGVVLGQPVSPAFFVFAAEGRDDVRRGQHGHFAWLKAVAACSAGIAASTRMLLI